MSRELIAAQSGWGKSWLAQQRTEEQIEEGSVDHTVVLDHEREMHGLVQSGHAKWIGVGEEESQYGTEFWERAIREAGNLVVAKAVGADAWRHLVGTIGEAAAALNDEVLLVIDEAHFVAPLRGSPIEEVQGIATTGRGRGVASIWITQRLAKLDTTISSQCDRRSLGGFTEPNDLDRAADVVDYPSDVHNPQLLTVDGIPDDIKADGEPVSVRETGLGSEWIYSTRSGDRRRIDSSAMQMSSNHLGPEGSSLTTPGES